MAKQTTKEPLVSVIMALYNEELRWAKEAIESILNQTHKNLQYIIVLDNPKNKELKVLVEDFQKKDKRIHFIKNAKNIGRGATRNKAIKVSKGEFIAIIDGDDIANKKRIQKQIEFLQKNKDSDLVFTWADFIDEDNKKISKFKPTQEDYKNIKKTIFTKHITLHPSMTLRAEILKELKYDVTLLRSQDFDFWLRALAKGHNFSILKEMLMNYRLPSKENTSRRVQKQRKYFKFTIKALLKNFKSYFTNIEYEKRLIYSLIMYTALIIIPDKVFIWYLDRKEKY